jgi:predicted O-methyltransferase YrrM
MKIIHTIKKYWPKKLWFIGIRLKSLLINTIANIPFTKERTIRKEKFRDYSNLKLCASTQKLLKICKSEAFSVYGDSWNYQSDALRHEMVYGFQTCIKHLRDRVNKINYLEIGSCQGLSMSIIGSIIYEDFDKSCKLYSIDPYGESGYFEKNIQVPINKSTKQKALSLYKLLNLNVNLIEEFSDNGLKQLISQNLNFNLIYIDGAHEGMIPFTDLALSLQLVSPEGAVIILDDHKSYDDVKYIKLLCDRNFKKIYENWKIAVYQIN